MILVTKTKANGKQQSVALSQSVRFKVGAGKGIGLHLDMVVTARIGLRSGLFKVMALTAAVSAAIIFALAISTPAIHLLATVLKRGIVLCFGG
jgi:hypothetical protein